MRTTAHAPENIAATPYSIAPNTVRELSAEERRVLAFERIHPGTPTYNVPVAVRWRTPLDVRRLRSSLDELVRRHAPLRTRFRECEAGDRAETLASARIPFSVVRLPSEGLADGALDSAIARVSAEPFALDRELPVRAHVFDLDGAGGVLLLVLHHVVSDMVTINVLLSDLKRIYASEDDGRDAGEGGAVAAQQAVESGDERAADDLSFWIDELADAPRMLTFAGAGPRPPVLDLRAGTRDFWVSGGTVNGLRALAERRGTTLLNVLLTTYGIVLARFSGQDEVVVGVPASVRTEQTARRIGFFVNTLPIRLPYDAEATVETNLDRVSARTRAAFRHRRLPLEQLGEHLASGAATAAHPFFQSCLNYRSFDTDIVDSPEDIWRPSTGTSPFDLTLTCEKVGGRLRARLEYAQAVISDRFAEAIVEAMGCALETTARTPATASKRVSLMRETTRARVLEASRGPALDSAPPVHVAAAVVARAERQPAAVAVVDARGRHTYASIVRRAAHLAGRLREAGVEPGAVVGVAAGSAADGVIAILGAWFARAAYVALDPEIPHERIAFIASDAGARVAIVSGGDERVARLGLATIGIEPDAGVAIEPPASGPAGDEPAYVLYTSGSTGRPKGVAISHRSLARSMEARRLYYAATPPERALLVYSFAFDPSLAVVFSTLIAGGTVFGADGDVRTDPAALAGLVHAERITHWDSVPSLYGVIVEAYPEKLQSLRCVILGGERLPAAVAQRHLLTQRARLANEYGPTEATIWATVADVPANAGIGRPIPGMHAYVLDAYGELVPPGVVGELCLGGEMLALGYWRRADLTRERFVTATFAHGERLYRTGDLAQLSADGDILFEGRNDDQLKLRGYRIELAEVERAVERHPGVREAVVVPRGDDADRCLVAFVALHDGGSLEDLESGVASVLPAYMRPARFVVLSAFPRMTTGKVDRKALEGYDVGEASHQRAYVSPRSAAERTLHAIWAELLGIDRISVDENVFDRGVHSLLAMKANVRIRAELAPRASVRDLFRFPTIEQYASSLPAQGAVTGTAGGGAPAGAERRERYLVSRGQEAIWLAEQLHPGTALFSIAFQIVTPLELDAVALRDAIGDVIERHSILRARFELADGQVYARREARAACAFDEVRAGDERELAQLAQRAATAAYDLTSEPLVRVTLVRLPRGNAVVIALHHIVADGSSVAILLRELGAAYARRTSLTGTAAAPPPQFLDRADRLRRENDERADDVAYWRERLAGLDAELEFPYDRPRARIPSYRGDHVDFHLDSSTRRGLQALARRSGATIFSVFVAAFATLLGRYSRAQTIALGVPVDVRGHVGLDDAIGYAVNMVPLRVELGRDPTFAELVSIVHGEALEAYEHAALPFERIVEVAQAQRDAARHPIVQTSVTMNPPLGRMRVFDEDRVRMLDNGTVKFDLVFAVEDHESHLQARLQFATDLLDRTTAERLAHNLRALLESAANDANVPAASLPLPADERRRVLALSEGPEVRSPEAALSLQHVFALRAAEQPDALAVVAGDERLTYADLERRSGSAAAALRDRGVSRGTCVGICVDRSAAFIVAVLAVLRAGGAYVPLDPATPRERIEMMADAVNMQLCIVDRLGEAAMKGTRGATVTVPALLAGSPSPSAEPVSDALDRAYVMFTSGSTGVPKAVSVPHAGVMNLTRVAEFAPVRANDVVGQLATFAFDASTYEIWTALLNGAALSIVPREVAADPEALGRYVVANGLTVMLVMTSLFNAIASKAAAAFDSVRVLVFGGEAGDIVPTRAMAQRCGPEIFHTYGPTECTVFSHVFRCTTEVLAARWKLAIGSPMANTRAYVLDRAQRLLPVGAVGEIYIGGRCVAEGYLANEILSAERFVPDPFRPGERLYRTGDLGRLTEDGSLEFYGRIDRQLKLHGYRIEPGEIESVLLAEPGVREATVVIDESGTDARLVAYVGADDTPNLVESLRKAARKKLSHYMLPSAIVRVPHLPVNRNGKVDRAALPPPTYDGAARALPANELEETIARIWADVLGLDTVGVVDNFFELGGHSLIAAKAAQRMQKSLGRAVPLRMLFEAPTVRELAAQLGRDAAPGARGDDSLLSALLGERDRAAAPAWFDQ